MVHLQAVVAMDNGISKQMMSMDDCFMGTEHVHTSNCRIETLSLIHVIDLLPDLKNVIQTVDGKTVAFYKQQHIREVWYNWILRHGTHAWLCCLCIHICLPFAEKSC